MDTGLWMLSCSNHDNSNICVAPYYLAFSRRLWVLYSVKEICYPSEGKQLPNLYLELSPLRLRHPVRLAVGNLSCHVCMNPKIVFSQQQNTSGWLKEIIEVLSNLNSTYPSLPEWIRLLQSPHPSYAPGYPVRISYHR
jgi:hypothetical protein